ncbi:hypothetical protein C8J56DRAFT_880925 [Mycena floridula]|nr:hypothetical protein C8J56DRAFT_880925 [Mycena floridula]
MLALFPFALFFLFTSLRPWLTGVATGSLLPLQSPELLDKLALFLVHNASLVSSTFYTSLPNSKGLFRPILFCSKVSAFKSYFGLFAFGLNLDDHIIPAVSCLINFMNLGPSADIKSLVLLVVTPFGDSMHRPSALDVKDEPSPADFKQHQSLCDLNQKHLTQVTQVTQFTQFTQVTPKEAPFTSYAQGGPIYKLCPKRPKDTSYAARPPVTKLL